MTAPAVAPDRGLHRFAARAMASPLGLSVAGDVPEALARRAWAEVCEEFEAAEQAMSRFRDDSGLTLLNRAALEGRTIEVDGRLRRAVVAADRARRLTGGAFDARVLGDLDRLGYRGAELPAQASDPGGSGDPATPGAAAGASPVSLRRDGTMGVAAPVDMGGIGKGLALRWAMARVRRVLPDGAGALVEAGGDLVASGPGPDLGAWPIAIEDPAGGEDLAVVALTEGALSTSSVRINRWVRPDGSVAHHLLDPRTGDPGGDGLLAVTVAAPDPAWAEVRTKELFLAGVRDIGRRARGLGLAAWWVCAEGSLEMTPAGRLMTAWIAAEADEVAG